MKCPKCSEDCQRDEADVGVRIVYGPWGCPGCGWSEEAEYDLSTGAKSNEYGTLDQFGGLIPGDVKLCSICSADCTAHPSGICYACRQEECEKAGFHG